MPRDVYAAHLWQHNDSLVVRANLRVWFQDVILTGVAFENLVYPWYKPLDPGRVERAAPAAAALVTKDSRRAAVFYRGFLRMHRRVPRKIASPEVVLVSTTHQFDSQGCSLGPLGQVIPCCWPIRETAVVQRRWPCAAVRLVSFPLPLEGLSMRPIACVSSLCRWALLWHRQPPDR